MSLSRSISANRAAGFALAAGTGSLLFFARLPAGAGLRMMLIVMGIIVAAAAAARPAAGLSAYVFFLLTANSLPYFFSGRHGRTPIPIAAVLFAFLVSGWLMRKLPAGDRERGAAGQPARPSAVAGPLRLAAALVAVSGVVTVWRWMNFFPFSGGRVYDWMTNANGLPASGARTLALMGALSYLLPFAFFAIVLAAARSRRDLDPALRAAGWGLGLAALFAFVQHFAAPGLGNTDFWIFLGQINATFKDPNAFAGVLAILLPLLLGAAVDGWRNTESGRRKGPGVAVAAAAFVLGFAALPWTGTRSAVLAAVVGLAVFAAVAFGRAAARKTGRRWKGIAAAAAGLIVICGVFFFRSTAGRRLTESVKTAVAAGDIGRLSPERYYLWKHALAMTRDYPVSGVGIGAYLVELPDYYVRDKSPVPAGYENYQRIDSAENFFLHAAAELGLAGLAAFLAVLIGLAMEIRRGVRRGVLRGPDRLIFAGAAGGLAAFVVNALFHSFAQSYETLFCFWFVAAVVVVCGRGEGPEADVRAAGAGTKAVSRILRAAGAALLVVFAGVLLLDSFRTLSISGKTAALGLSQEYGLYRSESNLQGASFRWTRGEAAWTVNISGRRLLLPVTISHPDAAERPVRVRVFLGGPLLKKAVVLGDAEWTEPGRKILEFEIPPGYSGEGMIGISVDRTWAPAETGDENDPRRLGAAVEKAEFAGDML